VHTNKSIIVWTKNVEILKIYINFLLNLIISNVSIINVIEKDRFILWKEGGVIYHIILMFSKLYCKAPIFLNDKL